jgi:hypothetical protein
MGTELERDWNVISLDLDLQLAETSRQNVRLLKGRIMFLKGRIAQKSWML